MTLLRFIHLVTNNGSYYYNNEKQDPNVLLKRHFPKMVESSLSYRYKHEHMLKILFSLLMRKLVKISQPNQRRIQRTEPFIDGLGILK